MGNTFLLVHIVEGFDHLPQEHPATFFSDISADLNQVEDLVGDIFHDNIHNICEAGVGETIFARINCSHYFVLA